MTKDKIIDKIRKCLALAGSSEPHEAAAALERAQQLMASHGVSEMEIGTAGDVGEAITTEDVRSIATATKTKSWETRLFWGVSEAFGCRLLFCSGYPYANWKLIGFESEVATAAYAATTLLRQLRKGRAAFTKQLNENLYRSTMPRKKKTSEVDAYCMGWVRGAVSKLKTLAEAKVEAAEANDAARGTNTALVVQTAEEKRLAALRAHVAALSTGAAKGQGRRARGSAVSEAQGYAEGQQASVHHGLDTNGRKVAT